MSPAARSCSRQSGDESKSSVCAARCGVAGHQVRMARWAHRIVSIGRPAQSCPNAPGARAAGAGRRLSSGGPIYAMSKNESAERAWRPGGALGDCAARCWWCCGAWRRRIWLLAAAAREDAGGSRGSAAGTGTTSKQRAQATGPRTPLGCRWAVSCWRSGGWCFSWSSSRWLCQCAGIIKARPLAPPAWLPVSHSATPTALKLG